MSAIKHQSLDTTIAGLLGRIGRRTDLHTTSLASLVGPLFAVRNTELRGEPAGVVLRLYRTAGSMGVQEIMHIPVAALQGKLSFVSTDPLPWKNYVLASSTAVWAFETYLQCVETFVVHFNSSNTW
jgi:hypothetical protein